MSPEQTGRAAAASYVVAHLVQFLGELADKRAAVLVGDLLAVLALVVLIGALIRLEGD